MEIYEASQIFRLKFIFIKYVYIVEWKASHKMVYKVLLSFYLSYT